MLRVPVMQAQSACHDCSPPPHPHAVLGAPLDRHNAPVLGLRLGGCSLRPLLVSYHHQVRLLLAPLLPEARPCSFWRGASHMHVRIHLHSACAPLCQPMACNALPQHALQHCACLLRRQPLTLAPCICRCAIGAAIWASSTPGPATNASPSSTSVMKTEVPPTHAMIIGRGDPVLLSIGVAAHF